MAKEATVTFAIDKVFTENKRGNFVHRIVQSGVEMKGGLPVTVSNYYYVELDAEQEEAVLPDFDLSNFTQTKSEYPYVDDKGEERIGTSIWLS